MLTKSIPSLVLMSLTMAAYPAFAASGPSSAVLNVSAGSKLSGEISAMTGGFGPGNGGDGLELSSPPASEADVFVPTPSGFGETGTLLVSGTPGAGQRRKVKAAYCKSDAQGQLLKYGCGEYKSYLINQPIQLSYGTYLINYSNAEEYIQIRVGQETQVELKKIRVGSASQSDVSFKVFVDLTDPSEQNLELRNLFTNSDNQTIYAESCCDQPASQDVQACNAFASDDYHQFLNKVAQFNPDGTWSIWGFFPGDSTPGRDDFYNQGRRYVADPASGQFVSVLPGVYGIEFTDIQTGQTQDQYGIKVE